MSLKEEILSDTENFMQSTGLSATRFGLEFANDGKFVKELREGRDITIGMADRLRAFMRSYKNTNNTPTASSVSKDGGAIG